MMLEFGRAFTFTNGNQQHSPTETNQTHEVPRTAS